MITILFIRNDNAFLPEIDAYIDYFNKTREFEAYDSLQLQEFNLEDFDVVWEFKGIGGYRKKTCQILVHEYASLSTGIFPKLKNTLKVKYNPRPDIRVFLNENVSNGFKFNDKITYCYRDMGINEQFVFQAKVEKEYDFVYVGSVCKDREMDKFLKVFTAGDNGTLCLIGDVDDDIYDEYKNHKNLYFIGKVKYSDVPSIAIRAEYGVNFMPDKYPYNIQTSTKLLEYLALGLKVVTTDYKWVREFEEKHNCSFYKLNFNNLKFNKKSISNYEFSNGFNAEEYMWDNIIEKSGIQNKLIELYNNQLKTK